MDYTIRRLINLSGPLILRANLMKFAQSTLKFSFDCYRRLDTKRSPLKHKFFIVLLERYKANYTCMLAPFKSKYSMLIYFYSGGFLT